MGQSYHITRNLEAEKLWAYFKHHWSDIDYQLEQKNMILEVKPFENGRERGYTLISRTKYTSKVRHHVNFAQYRSSDSIVIYPFNWDASIDNLSREEFDQKTISLEPTGNYLWEAFVIILRKLGLEMLG